MNAANKAQSFSECAKTGMDNERVDPAVSAAKLSPGAARPEDPPAAGEPRLPFHDRLAHVDRDIQALANRVAQHYPLHDFGARRGFERGFLHRSSTCQAGSVLLSGGYTTPISGTVGAQQGIGAVNLILSGCMIYESEGKELRVENGRPLFFSPGQDYHFRVEGHFNGIALHLDLQRLKQTAAAIAGIGVSERRFIADLEFTRAVRPHDLRSQQLLQTFLTTFQLLDHPELEMRGDLHHLGLDDLIYRNLALLLLPGLDAVLRISPQQRSGRERIFEELVEWVEANLHSSISLSELEARSGYSRRNLQLAFHERFGCGPIQWVRRQRLERARQDLLNAGSDDSVASVAARYGFGSLSVFSRDFKTHFGLRPSEVLREGRRLVVPAPLSGC